MRRADRLFQIILLLGRGKVQTARALALRLEVTERTIYRDVRDLVGAGVPIKGAAGVGYSLQSGYRIPPMMFDEEELQALAFGADVARIWGDRAMGAAAERILDKIDAVLPARLRPKLALSGMFVPDFHVSERLSELLGQVRAAINAKRRLRIRYQDAAGASTDRVVWPLSLIYWGSSWTLGAWCELRDGFRNFRVDRIATARLTTATIPDVPGRRLADYIAAVSAETAE